MLFTGSDDVLSQLDQVEQRHQWNKRQREWHGSTPTKNAVQMDLKNWRRHKGPVMWSVFCDLDHRCCDNAQPFLFGICRKDVSVLTQGHQEILRHFQGSRRFPRNQRLRLETPGWEVLDYEGKVITPAEVERQRERLMRAPLVIYRNYPFSEDVVVVETDVVDPNPGIMRNVSSLIEILPLGGSYELVHQFWAHFNLSAVPVNVDVTWSHDEVLVSICICFVTFT